MAGKYWVASLVTMLFLIPFNVFLYWPKPRSPSGCGMSPRTIPLIIAQEQGLFAKQGIEARVVLIS
jgi:hypothetical protein